LSFRSSGPARPPDGRTAIKLPRWPRYLVPVLAGLIAFVVVLVIIAGVWTDFLWYRSVNYGSVFGVTYGTRWALFFIGGIFMALVTGLNAVVAFRLRPAYRPVASQRPGVETYRLAVDPHRRLLLGIVLALVGLISGLSLSGAWRTWLLFANQVPFGQKDPQFKLDISFFVFTYPFIRLVLGYLFAAVLLSLVMAVAVRGGQVPGVIMHTDQGSEYTAGLVRQACARLGISQSMGRPGSALDNAVIESWHSTLEFELRSLEHFTTRAAARARIRAWIEDYNRHRRHSALGMMSPVSYEQALKTGKEA